jgi:NTE family protein
MRSLIIIRNIVFFFLLLVCQSLVNAYQSNDEFFVDDPSESKPRIALVLSGGGARGMAQIGVLQEFERAGIKIDHIVGTSMGAIIGGLYSVGYSADELDSIVSNADWDDILSLDREIERKDVFLEQKYLYDRSIILLRFNNFDLRVPEGLVIGIRFQYFLQNLLWQGLYKPLGDFSNLKYDFRPVATEVISGKSVAFSKGNLVNSIIASATVPLRNSPVRIDSSIYLDGGLKANLPVEQAKEIFDPDIIIAVNTTSPLFTGDKLDKPWNLADQVLSIMMQDYTKKAIKQADILIEPEIDGLSNTDFDESEMLILQGRESAKKMLPKIHDLIQQKSAEILVSKASVAQQIQIDSIAKIDMIEFSGIDPDHLFERIEFDSVSIKNIPILQSNLVDAFADNDLIRVDTIEYMNQVPVKMMQDLRLIDSTIKSKPLKNNADQLKKIKEDILKIYHKYGYSFANIKLMKYDPNSRRLIINIDIGEVKNIKISGNTTSDFIILRELVFDVGDTLNTDILSESWSNLASVELFKNVEFDFYTYNDYCGVDVNIDVEEMGDQILSVGARADNERFGQIGIDLVQMNLFNFGARANLRFTGGPRNQSISVALEQPRVMSSLITFGVRTYYSNYGIYRYKRLSNDSKGETIYEYDREGENNIELYGMNASLGTQIEKKGLLSLQFRFDRQRYYDIESDVKSEFYSINTMKIASIFDSENENDFPTSGRLIEIFLETTTLQTPDGVGFSKASFFYRGNNSIGSHTFIPSFLFGYADETLPYPEFFSLGGQDDFFGLNENAEMGRQIIRGSLEYRYKTPFQILFDTYFSIRYDIGSVWILPEEIKISKLKHGIGTSLALDTPIGPAKFSIGKSFYFIKDPASVIYGPLLLYFRIGMHL